jgi:hypothetical protein
MQRNKPLIHLPSWTAGEAAGKEAKGSFVTRCSFRIVQLVAKGKVIMKRVRQRECGVEKEEDAGGREEKALFSLYKKAAA